MEMNPGFPSPKSLVAISGAGGAAGVERAVAVDAARATWNRVNGTIVAVVVVVVVDVVVVVVVISGSDI